MLVVPVIDQPVAEPPNIIGTRERALRVPRRIPRVITIDPTMGNTITSPLKLLARLDNKAIAGIKPRLIQNPVRVGISLAPNLKPMAYSGIKTQLQPITVKARLALVSSSRSMWATALGRLKLRPQTQTIESLKAINADRIDKLHKLAMLAMMIETL